MARYNLSPGAPIVAAAPKGVTGASAAVITPRGREIALIAVDGEAAPAFRYTQTQLPGSYRVRFKAGAGSPSEVPFQVARDASESHFEPLAAEERDKLLVPAGVQFAGAEARVVPSRDSPPRREPFWGFLLAALVALLIGELLMSTWLARQRSGWAVSTS
jgi:hypothetical protein